MIETPVFDWLVTESSWGISWIAFSSLSVTSCSTRSGEAPGKTVCTMAVRMMKPGSSDCGMPR